MTASVVLCGANGGLAVANAAAALERQCARHGAEFIVVIREGEADRASDDTRRLLEGARVIRAPDRMTRSEMRALGLGAATGTWTALTETPCIAEPEWLSNLLGSPATDADVIGGAIGNHRDGSAADRAAFFAEYGIYQATTAVMLPGCVPHIAAANVAYHSRVRDEVIAHFARDESEPEVHRWLHATGRQFQLVPAARVRSDRSVDFSTAWRERVTHGREFGCVRARDEGPAMRCLRAIAAPLAVPLLLWRIARVADTPTRRALWRTLPQTTGLFLAWAYGEAMGSVTGRCAA